MVVAVVAALLAWPALRTDGGVADLLRGPDDFMRMVQVVDWLDGQGWHDTAQRRLTPPDRVAMHWSRLADLPLATTIRAAETPLGRERAMRAAVIAVPTLLGGILVALFFWVAAPLAPGARVMAPLVAVPALLLPLVQFRPGRVDHHGLQLVLVALAAGFLLRTLGTGRTRPAAAAGGVAAASLAVGLETLPFAATAAVALALAAVAHRDGARPFAAFGAALCTVAPALFLITTPASEWGAAACDRLSLPHLVGAASVAAAGIAAIAVRRMRPASAWRTRLAVVGASGVAGIALVATLHPQCAGGPYAELAPEVRYWFDNVREVRGLLEFLADRPGTAASYALLPLAAIAVAALRLAKPARYKAGACRDPGAPGSDRTGAVLQRITLLALALSGAAVLAWQMRGIGYAGLTAAVALLPLAAALNARAGRLPRLPARLALRLAMPAACAAALFLPVVVQPRTADGDEPVCDLAEVLPTLNDTLGFDAEPATVAAPIDFGPEILLRSPHAVLAAPYHRNVAGFADHRRIFAGTEAEALAVVARRGIDAVLFCPRYVGFTAHPGKPGFLNDRLTDDQPPDWLVPVARADDLALFRVDLSRAERPLEGSAGR